MLQSMQGNKVFPCDILRDKYDRQGFSDSVWILPLIGEWEFERVVFLELVSSLFQHEKALMVPTLRTCIGTRCAAVEA
jgi:hypothetical protein